MIRDLKHPHDIDDYSQQAKCKTTDKQSTSVSACPLDAKIWNIYMKYSQTITTTACPAAKLWNCEYSEKHMVCIDQKSSMPVFEFRVSIRIAGSGTFT